MPAMAGPKPAEALLHAALAALRGSVQRRRAAVGAGVGVMLTAVLVSLVGSAGWLLRDRIPLTPDAGVGYALGVGGGAAMLLLSLYSPRKRLRFMRRWGPVSQWFRLHMLLGVIAPLLILFHCNFRSGAPNSNVALASMLVVATSGVVGRYLYTRVSHGLYGARATLEELRRALDASTLAVGGHVLPACEARQRLAAFATEVHSAPRRPGGRWGRLVTLPLRARRVRRRVLWLLHADLAREAERQQWDGAERRAREAAAREIVGGYIDAILKEVQFGAYERLFALWHALHVPLFAMLVLSGLVHVIAVHMY
jgi:hypothetical protein